ncbi:helix-turn-helix transcriptional regulator [Legionella brunensis]|uniref:Helix-turn-helix protein n=1 Tax=Legionella brunensis TaxID=29422 RepID=A0A0W0SK44_9GAMM|nr:helix-turn-helix transcriptional regulator [Legionella brunensis]KTC83734.1 helix-turn-helix protein [Legionella brunensis]
MAEKIVTTGERIKSARMQLGFSRKAFEEKFGIPAATLQAWESGKYEISTKGINRFVEALYKAGLATTPDWFIRGIGLAPRLIESTSTTLFRKLNSEFDPDLTEDEIILKEVDFFEQINPNPMIIVISDDTMEPIFNIGDYVGGNLIPGRYAYRYIGSLCIVELHNNEFFIRRVNRGTKPNLFNLVCINMDTTSENCYLLDKEIISLAQIVWHRKNEKFSDK